MTRRLSSSAAALALVISVVAVIPRLLTIGHFMTIDERLWVQRTNGFSDALFGGHLSQMTGAAGHPGTMPGITTVWLGTIGRLTWGIAKKLGMAPSGQSFDSSFTAFTFAQAMVAIATAALIGLLVWLLCKWASRRAAAVTGLLIATEPFWVAHGSVLHTDELTTLFGLTAVIATAWVWGIPGGVTPPRHQKRWALVAGALLVCSTLTKLSGLVFIPACLLIVVWASIRQITNLETGQSRWVALRPMLTLGGVMTLAAVTVTIVLYPALWLSPAVEIRHLTHAVGIAELNRKTYFNGHVARWPSLWFYPVSIAYRTTPWMLVAIPIGTVAALYRKSTRPRALLMCGSSVVPAIALLVTMAHYDRYGLLVLGFAAVLVGLACSPKHPTAERQARWPARTIALGGALALLFSVSVAPWGLAYFNPVLSQIKAPEKIVRIDWGESQTLTLPAISADARAHGKNCHSVSVVTLYALGKLPLRVKCNYQKGTLADADYLVITVDYRQLHPDKVAKVTKGRLLVDTVSRQGVPYVQIWRRPDAFSN